jgi:phytoene dehydrogenase-like protein
MATSALSGSYDAVVVGAGPNGLAAAVRLAQAKHSVLLLEANDTIGGGTRSAPLTLPGFTHDLCSAVHPMALASPFFRQLPLEEHGLKWIEPTIALAHPLANGRAAVLERSVDATAARLGSDGRSYHRLMTPLTRRWDNLAAEFLQPFLHLPRHPFQLAQFGLASLRSAKSLVEGRFSTEQATALIAGLAAHSFLPLEQIPSAAFALVLGMVGHARGWPVARGGSQAIADALASLLRSLGGEIRTGHRVESLGDLPKARVTLFDVTPRQLLRICGDQLPAKYRERLSRFTYGPGVFKIDYALDGPVPWQADECRRAGTVHVGGTFAEIAQAEREACQGIVPERPFVLVAQASLFDSTRAPDSKHTLWAYCHVPHGSAVSMVERVEGQIERFAPGFRDRILTRHTMDCLELERKNANLVGGSIDGGAANLWQLLARPVLSPTPYRVPMRGVYLCSSSTPPGGGVHGMCGYYAAQAAIRDWFS